MNTKVQLSGALRIAQFEFLVFRRNKVVVATAIAIPLLFSIVLARVPGSFPHAGILASLQLAMIAGLGTYVTATTTLSSRRQLLYLKRLRGTTVSNAGIVAGILAPVILVNLLQVTIVLGFISGSVAPPSAPVVLVLGIVAMELMLVILAVATSGLTNSPEHAQITTVPVFALMVGLAAWGALPVEGWWIWVRRLIPGGGSIELVTGGWAALPTHIVLVDCVISMIWCVVALQLARMLFRWDPRLG